MITNDIAIEMTGRAIVLATKFGHAQDTARWYARDSRGVMCPHTSVHARAFSVRGYLMRAAFEMGYSVASRSDRNAALLEAMTVVLDALDGIAMERFSCTLDEFNDRDETTRQDVLKLLFSVPVAEPDGPYFAGSTNGLVHISNVVERIAERVSSAQTAECVGKPVRVPENEETTV